MATPDDASSLNHIYFFLDDDSTEVKTPLSDHIPPESLTLSESDLSSHIDHSDTFDRNASIIRYQDQLRAATREAREVPADVLSYRTPFACGTCLNEPPHPIARSLGNLQDKRGRKLDTSSADNNSPETPPFSNAQVSDALDDDVDSSSGASWDTLSTSEVDSLEYHEDVASVSDSLSLGQIEHADTADASTRTEEVTETTLASTEDNTVTTSSSQSHKVAEQPNQFEDFWTFMETHYADFTRPSKKNDIEKERSLKQFGADEAFGLNGMSLEEYGREWGMFTFLTFVPCVCAVTYALVNERSAEEHELVVLFLLFWVWWMTRTALKLNKEEKWSYWAVRVFADGYVVLWMLTSIWEIFKDGSSTTAW